jgi:hypothetical protein
MASSFTASRTTAACPIHGGGVPSAATVSASEAGHRPDPAPVQEDPVARAGERQREPRTRPARSDDADGGPRRFGHPPVSCAASARRPPRFPRA